MDKIIGDNRVRYENIFFVENPVLAVVAHPILIVEVEQRRVDGLDRYGRVRWYFFVCIAQRGGTHLFSVGLGTIAIGTDDDIAQSVRIVIEQVYLPACLLVMYGRYGFGHHSHRHSLYGVKRNIVFHKL